MRTLLLMLLSCLGLSAYGQTIFSNIPRTNSLTASNLFLISRPVAGGTRTIYYSDIMSDVRTNLGAAAALTLDTGQGANELYDMDQNVLTTSSPTFAAATLSGTTGSAALTGGWTNSAYPWGTLTTSGTTITSGIATAFGIVYAGFQVVSNGIYCATFNLTVNSGTAPFVDFATSSVADGVQSRTLTVAGTNRVYLISKRTGAEFILLTANVAVNLAISSFDLRLISPSVSALEIKTGFLLVTNQAQFSGGITAQKNIQSEVYGFTASAGTNNEATIVGYNATSTGGGYVGQNFGGAPTLLGFQTRGSGTAIGYKAQATNFEAIAIGPQTRAGGLATIAIGDAARALPTGPNGNQVVIGDVVWATGDGVYLIGGGSGSARNYIAAFPALGASVSYNKEIATADHQGFLGWYQEDANANFTSGAGGMNDWWLGGPVTAQAPHEITLNITSGLGTNIAGKNFTIVASKATGSAASGDFIIQTGDVGSTGSTLQTATTKFRIGTNGVASAPLGFSGIRSNLLAPSSLTFPATTVNWTNPLPVSVMVYIDNSGVTGTAIKKNGTTIFQLMTGPATLGLQVGEYFSQTYTIGTPTASYHPFP